MDANEEVLLLVNGCEGIYKSDCRLHFVQQILLTRRSTSFIAPFFFFLNG